MLCGMLKTRAIELEENVRFGRLWRNFQRVLQEKYELNRKINGLQETISSMHIQTNLLRDEVSQLSSGRQETVHVAVNIGELKSKLQATHSELQRTRLYNEQLCVDLRQASERLVWMRQNSHINDIVVKETMDRMKHSEKMQLKKTTSQYRAKMVSLQQDIADLGDSRSILEKNQASCLNRLNEAQQDAKEQPNKTNQKTDESNAKMAVFAKLRAQTLLMSASQKLRRRGGNCRPVSVQRCRFLPAGEGPQRTKLDGGIQQQLASEIRFSAYGIFSSEN